MVFTRILAAAILCLAAISCGEVVEQGDLSIPPTNKAKKLEDGNASFNENATLTPMTELNVEVAGLRNLNGSICFSIFQGADGFPKDDAKAVHVKCFSAKDKYTPTVSVESGKSYALAMFHDENNNGDLDLRKLGPFETPGEGFGFSNNPSLKPRAPKYSEVEFKVDGDSMNIKIELLYLF